MSAGEPATSVLDQLIAKLETKEPLRLKQRQQVWQGKAQARLQQPQASQSACAARMISLRLNQLASQQANERQGLTLTRAYKPHSSRAGRHP